MELKEIEERLEKGEELYCPECDLFNNETEDCEIIICGNPFIGYSELEIETHKKEIYRNFNKYYK